MEAASTSGIKYLLQNFHRLYFSPSRFFSNAAPLKSISLIAISSYLFALSDGLVRIEHKILRYNLLEGPSQREALINSMVADWLLMWGVLLGIAALSSFFVWLIGGWFFNLRLRWSGAKDVDKDLGRAVYLISNMAYAVPMVLVMIAASISYRDYLHFYSEDAYLGLIPTFFFAWSLLVTYKAIKVNFAVKKWLVIFWFIITPILFNTFILVLFAYAGVYA